MKRSSLEAVCSCYPSCTEAPQRNSCAVDTTVWEALLGALLSRQRKVFFMRTMTIAELNQQIDLALERLRQCLNAPHYCAWPISSKSLAEAEELLIEARKKAKRKIRRLGAKYPSMSQSINWQWISYVLTAETWRFTLWLRDHHGYAAEGLQQQEEMELLFICSLGAEIKRLGFQLDV